MPTFKMMAAASQSSSAARGYAQADKTRSCDTKLSSPAVDDQIVGKVLTAMAAGKEPSDIQMSLGQAQAAAKTLLRALDTAYSESSFQAEIASLQKQTDGNQDKYLWLLGPAAAAVQQPVFARFGLPAGGKGVFIMKAGVKKLAENSPDIKRMSGDVRQLLLLPREEPEAPSVSSVLRDLETEQDKQRTKLLQQLQRAPAELLRTFTKTLGLPDSSSLANIADACGTIHEKAEKLADERMACPRSEIIGPGTILGTGKDHMSDDEIRDCLVASFEGYLQKMLARIVTPLEDFTSDPAGFRCQWATDFLKEHHATALFGARREERFSISEASLGSCGMGITVADETIDEATLQRAREVLDKMDADGQVGASKDPCNVGARSVWLHFETESERSQMHPHLLDLCLKLAGMPDALTEIAKSLSPGALAEKPRLRVHPHVMAANYRKGAEYHVHKDSYDGADNQRKLTIMLYLNPDWRPEHVGELRIYSESKDTDKPNPDMERYVDIAPLNGRIVIFRSRDVWHAVREPQGPGLRWALCLWVMAD